MVYNSNSVRANTRLVKHYIYSLFREELSFMNLANETDL
jgi:hypothetical protein